MDYKLFFLCTCDLNQKITMTLPMCQLDLQILDCFDVSVRRETTFHLTSTKFILMQVFDHHSFPQRIVYPQIHILNMCIYKKFHIFTLSYMFFSRIQNLSSVFFSDTFRTPQYTHLRIVNLLTYNGLTGRRSCSYRKKRNTFASRNGRSARSRSRASHLRSRDLSRGPCETRAEWVRFR